jgi:hypothetical protein
MFGPHRLRQLPRAMQSGASLLPYLQYHRMQARVISVGNRRRLNTELGQTVRSTTPSTAPGRIVATELPHRSPVCSIMSRVFWELRWARTA